MVEKADGKLRCHMLLAIGLALGCVTAWHWVAKEGREIREHEENDHE